MVQLADGPELPSELPLASPHELGTLFAQPVGVLGFPSFDNQRWPADGERPEPTYRSGVISHVSSFSGAANGPSRNRQMVYHTMDTWFGFSGSPNFLPNGHVVAIDTGARREEHENTKTIVHFGVRIDCLWELLCYYDELAEKINLAVDRDWLDLRRDAAGPQGRRRPRGVRLVHQANRLILEGRYGLACEYGNRALGLVPGCGKAYQVRSEASPGTRRRSWNRLPYEDIETELKWALRRRPVSESAFRTGGTALSLFADPLVAVVYPEDATQRGDRQFDDETARQRQSQRRAARLRLRRAIATDYNASSRGRPGQGGAHWAPYGKVGSMAYTARRKFCQRHGCYEKPRPTGGHRRTCWPQTGWPPRPPICWPGPTSPTTTGRRLWSSWSRHADHRYHYWSHLELLAKAYYGIGERSLARAWLDKSLDPAPETERPRLLADQNAYRSGASRDGGLVTKGRGARPWDPSPDRPGESRGGLLPTEKAQTGPEPKGPPPGSEPPAPTLAWPPPTQPAKARSADATTRFEEAKRLLDNGWITEEQFNAKKRQIPKSL